MPLDGVVRMVWDMTGGLEGERVSKATCLLFGLGEQAQCDGVCALNSSRHQCGLNSLNIQPMRVSTAPPPLILLF